MKTKRPGNGITKKKFNNNNQNMRKGYKSKVQNIYDEAGNVISLDAPNKWLKAQCLSARAAPAPVTKLGAGSVQGRRASVAAAGAAKSPGRSAPAPVTKSGADDSQRRRPSVGAAKSPGTDASKKKKRNSSTAPDEKPCSKKMKQINGGNGMSLSNNNELDRNKINYSNVASTIPLELDNDSKVSDISIYETQQHTFSDRSGDGQSTELTQVPKNIGTCEPKAAELVSKNLLESQRDDGTCNLDQSQEDLTSSNSRRDDDTGNLDQSQEDLTSSNSQRDYDTGNLDQSHEDHTSSNYQRDDDTGNLDQSQEDLTSSNSRRDDDTGNLDQSQEDLASSNSQRDDDAGNLDQSHKDHTSNNRRIFQNRSSFTSFTGCCIVGKARKKILVSMQSANKLVIEGCYCIKPVFGRVRVLGYTIREGEKRAVFSPCHRALVQVTCAYERGSFEVLSNQGESGREKGEGRQEEGARKSSYFVDGILGVRFSEEMLQSLQNMYGLDGCGLASLHLEIGAHSSVVELSSFHSRLPEVLQHISVPSLVMDQPPRTLYIAPLSFLSPTKGSSAQTDANRFGHKPAVHFEVCTGQDFNSVSTDKRGLVDHSEIQSTFATKGSDPSKTLVTKFKDQEEELIEAQKEDKLDKEWQSNEVSPSTSRSEDTGRPSNTCDVYEWYSVLGGAKPRLYGMGERMPVVTVPWSWGQVVRDFKKAEAEVEISGFKWFPKRRVVIIGDKGAGKSTFLKYFINSLLDNSSDQQVPPSTEDRQSNPKKCSLVGSETGGFNKSKGLRGERRAVCCLDLDPGQPEQSLPGSLSVCRYSNPLLGPAFTYGLATAKTRKELSDKKKMFERRRKMVQQLQSLQKTKGGADDRFMELRELLEDTEAVEDQPLPGEVTKQLLLGDVSPELKPHLYIDVVRELMETVRREHSDEPLVVNTMGWLSELGMAFLLDILKIVVPTHVIHLTSDKGPELDHLYMSHLFKSKLFGKVTTANPIFEYAYFQVSSPSSNMKAIKNSRKTPGPRDLRSLMFTSYFTALWSADSTVALDVKTFKLAVKLKYTDLAVHDLRFSDNTEAVLENMRQNRALVALCSTDPANIFEVEKRAPKGVEIRPLCKLPLNSFFNSNQVEEDRAAGQKSRQVLIHQHTKTHRFFNYLQEQANDDLKEQDNGGKVAPTLTNRVHELHRSGRRAAFEVHGWAIVLDVNTATKEVHLLTPNPEISLPKTNTLVRCSVDLPRGFNELIFQSLQ